jgi:hypothetical protein
MDRSQNSPNHSNWKLQAPQLECYRKLEQVPV